jgi:hypothetical protein
MVAEVETERPAEISRKINGGADTQTFALVRTLYLVQGHPPSEIEAMGLGVTRQQVSNWANRYGWATQKAKARASVEKSTQERVDASVQKVVEAIAIESEELCFKALNQTRAGLDKGGLEGAKQAQAASSTLRNLHGVAQAIRKPELQSAQSGSTSFNLFFLGGQSTAPSKEPIDVTPV